MACRANSETIAAACGPFRIPCKDIPAPPSAELECQLPFQLIKHAWKLPGQSIPVATRIQAWTPMRILGRQPFRTVGTIGGPPHGGLNDEGSPGISLRNRRPKLGFGRTLWPRAWWLLRDNVGGLEPTREKYNRFSRQASFCGDTNVRQTRSLERRVHGAVPSNPLPGVCAAPRRPPD